MTQNVLPNNSIPNPANFDFRGTVFTPEGKTGWIRGRYRLEAIDDFYWNSWLSIESDNDDFPSTDRHETIANPKAFTSFHSSRSDESQVLTWWITPPVDRVETNFPISLLCCDIRTMQKKYLATGLCNYTFYEAAS